MVVLHIWSGGGGEGWSGVTVWGKFSLKTLYYLIVKNSPFNIYLYFGKGTVEIYRGMFELFISQSEDK